jgi:hypothetical protein
VIEKLKERLIAVLKEKGEIDTPLFKDMTGASRKYTIPLLEYFSERKIESGQIECCKTWGFWRGSLWSV